METASIKSGHISHNRHLTEEHISVSKASMVRTLLYITYIIIPIAAGADKFFNILARWDQYMNPMIAKILPVAPSVFMKIAGVIEIAAGILVLIKPKIGAYVVSLWLVLIALQLLAAWIYPDVAVRDLAMAIGAYSLGNLLDDPEN